jgi:hypothetical protein
MVRIVSVILLIFCLAGCNRAKRDTEAVRQGVVDYFSQSGLNLAAMDVTMTSVQINGNQADAAVSISAKGGNASQGMQFKYHLEQKDSKWVVVGRQGGSAHGTGVAPPGAGSPRGGGAAPDATPPGASPHGGGAGGKMPSPEDLPPATKKQ